MAEFEVINTVNTRMANLYDFAVHIAGCSDVAKAKRAGCTVDQTIGAATAADAVETVYVDLEDGGFEYEEARLFTVHICPCAENHVAKPQTVEPVKRCSACGDQGKPDWACHYCGNRAWKAAHTEALTVGVSEPLAIEVGLGGPTDVEQRLTGNLDGYHTDDLATIGQRITAILVSRASS